MALEWRSSPRSRSSSSTSTRSISAAAPTASMPPAPLLRPSARPSSSLAEAAIIAGLVKAPSHYSPTADAEAAVGRAERRARADARERRRSAPAEAAGADPPTVQLEPRRRAQNSVRYFTDWVLPQLDMLIDETGRADRGLDHARPRHAARRRRRRSTPTRRAGAQGALVALDRDGAVRAMVGGTRLCRVDLQPRDPGDAPAGLGVQAVRLSRRARGRLQARRHGRRRAGHDRRLEPAQLQRPLSPAQIDVRTAFAYSINTVAAQLGQEVGFRTVADMARRFGITTPVNTHPSMVLGSSEVRLIDMTRAFAAVAREGRRGRRPTASRRVTTADGDAALPARGRRDRACWSRPRSPRR